MFGLFLKAVSGAIVWALANVVYYDLRRKGIRNFGRFAAFWVGTPTTWITLFAVREGEQRPLAPPSDDEDALLAEIRADKAVRRLRAPGRHAARAEVASGESAGGEGEGDGTASPREGSGAVGAEDVDAQAGRTTGDAPRSDRGR